MANDSAHPVQSIYHNTATAAITTAWTTLDTSLNGNASVVELYNSSTSFFELGIGTAPNLIPMLVFPSGGNGRIGLLLDSGCTLKIRATSATASTGVFAMNLFR